MKVDGTKKEINDEHKLDIKMEYFDECDLDSASEDEKYLLCSIFDRWKHCDFIWECKWIKIQMNMKEWIRKCCLNL